MNIKESPERIASHIYAMVRIRNAILNKIYTDTGNSREEATKAITELGYARLSILNKQDLINIKPIFIGHFDHTRFSVILDSLLKANNTVISIDDIIHFMNESMSKNRLIGAYKLYAILAIKYKGKEISVELINEWIIKFYEKGHRAYIFEIINTILDSTVQLNIENISSWMSLIIDDQKSEINTDKPCWEHFVEIILKLLEGCEKINDESSIINYPGIEGAVTNEHIRLWIKALKDTNLLDLAVKVEIAAFSKGYDEIDFNQLMLEIENIDGKSEGGVETRAYAIKNLPKGLLTVEDIRKWGKRAMNIRELNNGDYLIGPNKNAHLIAMAAIDQSLFSGSDLSWWIWATKKSGMREEMHEIIRAELSKQHEIPDLDLGYFEELILRPSHLEDSGKIICALLTGKFGEELLMNTAPRICNDYAACGHSELIPPIILAAIEARNNRVLQQIYSTRAERFEFKENPISVIYGLITLYTQVLNDLDNGAKILIAAVNNGNIDGVTDLDVVSLGEKLVETNKPSLGVEIGFATHDAGVEICEQQIQKWEAACYDGKTSEEAMDNAIALIKIYQSRPLLKKMNEGERKALVQEINLSFERMVKQQESIAITEATPYTEAVNKIRTILLTDM